MKNPHFPNQEQLEYRLKSETPDGDGYYQLVPAAEKTDFYKAVMQYVGKAASSVIDLASKFGILVRNSFDIVYHPRTQGEECLSEIKEAQLIRIQNADSQPKKAEAALELIAVTKGQIKSR